MGERFLACYSETAEAARGNDANCLATFPQNGAIANVGYEGSSSPSDGDSSVRCISAHKPALRSGRREAVEMLCDEH
jgi:hypothetical protein